MARTIINQDGAVVYRTKTMQLAQAAAFAKCLQANADRFMGVEIVEARTKVEQYFVAFQPVSRERQADMYEGQFNARKERAEVELTTFIFWKDPDRMGVYWCFSEGSGNTYELTTFDCDCPDATFRAARAGLVCKHRHALQMQIDAGMVGKTDKKSPLEREARNARIMASIDRDF